jgi:hypothetical protein
LQGSKNLNQDFEIIFDAALASEDIVFYTFFVSIEYHFKESANYYYFLSLLLGHAYNFINGAYTLAMFYCEKAIAIEPNSPWMPDFKVHYDYLRQHA